LGHNTRMASFPALPVFGLVAFAAGVAIAFFTHRVPTRGWIAVVLLLLASTAWALIESGESSRPSSFPMLLTFMVLAPVAIVYSFRARRRAPDRLLALAGFAGSFLVGAFLLFMLAGLVYSVFVL
jgi:uncharacterized protein YjeT (DUF2065 family)